jgi:hypothetical protein
MESTNDRSGRGRGRGARCQLGLGAGQAVRAAKRVDILFARRSRRNDTHRLESWLTEFLMGSARLSSASLRWISRVGLGETQLDCSASFVPSIRRSTLGAMKPNPGTLAQPAGIRRPLGDRLGSSVVTDRTEATEGAGLKTKVAPPSLAPGEDSARGSLKPSGCILALYLGGLGSRGWWMTVRRERGALEQQAAAVELELELEARSEGRKKAMAGERRRRLRLRGRTRSVAKRLEAAAGL